VLLALEGLGMLEPKEVDHALDEIVSEQTK
jgi:hypothetical protein